MKDFLDSNFLLQTDTAQELYHTHAEPMPIIDFHCHLDPKKIAVDYQFNDLSEIWIEEDHYKWRAMRANGVREPYITGNKTSFEKFEKWAETVPYTMRNPLYHWTHLELNRIFGIKDILSPATARNIYEECTNKLQSSEFRTRALITRMNIESICTIDDPIDSLKDHQIIQNSDFRIKVLPTWRPDKILDIDDVDEFNSYISKLEEASDQSIETFYDLIKALQKRHDFFEKQGCKLSDHSLNIFYTAAYTKDEVKRIFSKIKQKKDITPEETLKFQSAMLYELAIMDAESGWIQQFHIGAIRNNNIRMFNQVGSDSGFDSIGDISFIESMNRFFSRLDNEGLLAKTIVYNLNPKDIKATISNIYNFNDGTIPGKMQYGAAWWFLDQKKGIETHLNALSALGLLSRFVGMVTDSRSFLSYPRHEYFRRILCNLLGQDVENGELPSSELPFIGKIIEDICYNNAKQYLCL